MTLLPNDLIEMVWNGTIGMKVFIFYRIVLMTLFGLENGKIDEDVIATSQADSGNLMKEEVADRIPLLLAKTWLAKFNLYHAHYGWVDTTLYLYNLTNQTLKSVNTMSKSRCPDLH